MIPHQAGRLTSPSGRPEAPSRGPPPGSALAAWRIPWIHLAEALPIFAVIVVIHALVVVLLRARTLMIEATVLRLL